LIIGLCLALFARTFENYIDAEILSTMLAAFLIFATGGLHLEGLQKTFDVSALRPSGASASLVSSAIGIAAIIFVILFKIKALDILTEKLTLALLLTPVLARWAMLVFMYGSQRHAEGEARVIVENVRFWHVLFTTVATIAPATYLLGRTALWIGLSLSSFSLFFRGFLRKRNGLITTDNFGAVVELSEALSLILLASL
jgi:adenosylcobinamide-GDP ribazoletransferase